jgi:hypothetical protein
MAGPSSPSQDMSPSLETRTAADTLSPFTDPWLWPCPRVHPSHLHVHALQQPLLGLPNPSCLVAASGQLPLNPGGYGDVVASLDDRRHAGDTAGTPRPS